MKKIVNIIAPNWWNFSKDPVEFLAAREKIAEQILKLKYGDKSQSIQSLITLI